MFIFLILNCHDFYTNLNYMKRNIHFDISKPKKFHKIIIKLQDFHFLYFIFNKLRFNINKTLKDEDYNEIHKIKFINQY